MASAIDLERDYQRRREEALAVLRTLGVESMPLDLAAKLLPELPEWQKYRLPRRGRRRRRR